MSTKICPTCGTKFNPELDVWHPYRKFCSSICRKRSYYKGSSETRSLKRMTARKNIGKRFCMNCGKSFNPSSAFRFRTVKTCSDKCCHELSRKTFKSLHPKEFNKKHAFYARVRKHRKRAGGEGHLSYEEYNILKESQGNKCKICGKNEDEVKLTIDCIIPLSKGGKFELSNLQILCFSCNSRKGRTTDRLIVVDKK